ncbi:MAG: ATP-binding protein [Gemmataceae bacterium]|nr:ATP-binding protein [Gemmataceae bacterium]
MCSPCPKLPPREARSPGMSRDGWCCQTVQSRAAINQVLTNLATAMATRGYDASAIFEMRLAVDEALANAVKHGHRGDMTRPVRVDYLVTGERVLAEVEDQGDGFNPDRVPDPLAPENLGEPGGRGLFLMRSLVTWMQHNETGNRVTLCKCHTPP